MATRYAIRFDPSKYGDKWDVVKTKWPKWWPFFKWYYEHEFDTEEQAEAFIRRAIAYDGVREVPPFKFREPPPQEKADE